jgi:hypothetical protein
VATVAPLLLKIPTSVSSLPSNGPSAGLGTTSAVPLGLRMIRNAQPESWPTPGHSLNGATVVGAFAAAEDPA